jgi:Fis family transcriptional regulator
MSSYGNEISKIIKKAVNTYFVNLGGENPAATFYQDIIQSVERPLIEEVLQKVDFNQKKAAEVLGMSRNTLSKKISVLEISIKKETTS